MHRGAAKRADGIRDHVVAIEMPGDLAIGLRLRNFAMADVIPRSCRDEAKRFDAVAGIGIEHVAGDLFLDEARVRLVFVEGADDVIAIRPGVRARLVFVVAVGVAVVDDIEPKPSPTFAETRRGEQLLNEPRVGVRVRVGEKGIDFLGRRRQPDEVEVKPTAQRAGIRFR